jgi:hypothetical protein
MDTLRKYVEGIARLTTSPWHKLLVDHGRDFPAMARHRHTPGPLGQCFENSILLAGRFKTKLRYVEGYAVDMDIGVPLEHAWCIDANDGVVDITWSGPRQCLYYGVSFPPVTAAQIIKRLSYYGIGGNLWRDRDGSAWKMIEQHFKMQEAA